MSAPPTENGVPLDQFNDALRQSPGWLDFMRRNGISPTGKIKLSGDQREALRDQLKRAGVSFPKGMEIDPAGNVNQDQGVSKVAGNKWVQIGLIAGASVVTMGAAGFGPLAGVLGGSSTAAGTAGTAGVIAGTGIPTATAGVVAPTVATGVLSSAPSLSRWLAPALSYGVPAVTGLLAQRAANNADRDAAGVQADYLNRALDVEKEKEQYTRGQRADYLGRLQPYNAAGTAAVGRASDWLASTPMPNRYQPQPMGTPQGGLVALRDSRGEVRNVPAVEAERYLQQGAQRA